MKMQSNTIFITGGGSGIGRALAEEFHKLGNQIIIAGRREEMLEKTCGANPGMSYIRMDVTDAASIRSGAAEVIFRFPKLNCVINNAGIQRAHNFMYGEAVNVGFGLRPAFPIPGLLRHEGRGPLFLSVNSTSVAWHRGAGDRNHSTLRRNRPGADPPAGWRRSNWKWTSADAAGRVYRGADGRAC
jgi:NAD(P)-dependent dehydrogenase (short-subunit alcohol dehydrogenase family)